MKVNWKVRHDVGQLRKNPRISQDPRKLTVSKCHKVLCNGIILYNFLYPEKYYTSTKYYKSLN